jgi:hypothetical protein
MTMTRPWRRMTRHFWQILLTLGFTFTIMPLFSGRGRAAPNHG